MVRITCGVDIGTLRCVVNDRDIGITYGVDIVR
jgi:hypothetical protein